jgi:hypothetical protein
MIRCVRLWTAGEDPWQRMYVVLADDVEVAFIPTQ